MLQVDIRLNQGDFRLDATLDMRDPVIGLFGPSGSGKSTLLAALAGLKQPASGSIVMGERILFDADAGIDLPPYRRHIGLMFQEGHLFPHLNVRANLRYGMRRGQSAQRIFAFDHVVELLEIGPLLTRPVLSLSGGEKQRVALGRTLLAAPELLLLDEPLASLDERLKQQILPFLRRVKDEMKIPMIYVSHAINEILHLTSTLAVCDGGRIIAHGPFTDVIKSERVLALAHSLGLENVLKLAVIRHHAELGYTLARYDDREVHLPLSSISPGRYAYVSVRSENVALALRPVPEITIQNQLAGRVTRVTRIENRMLVEVDIGVAVIAEVTVKAVQDLGLREGAAVCCLIKSNALHYLGQDD